MTDLASARIDVASRTDRGVSARANALAITSGLPGRALLGALNGIAAEVFFTAATEVDDSFRPRAARSRTYRYYEAAPAAELAAYRRATRLVRGEVDVRSFGREIPADRPLRRSVRRFTATRAGAGLVLEIEAPSFVWGMVRKLVAAVRQVAAGELALASFRSALAGEARLTPPMAEPEPLVLWDVTYDVPWTVTAARPSDRQVAYFEVERRASRIRDQVLAGLGNPPFGSDEASIRRRAAFPAGIE